MTEKTEEPENPSSISMQPMEVSSRHERLTRVKYAAVVGLILICLTIYVANYISSEISLSFEQEDLSHCKSNLKNISTSLELYSKIWESDYPEDLAILTPEFLKTIPRCPSSATDTYSASYVRHTKNDKRYYFVCCNGGGHEALEIPAGYPQYDSVNGLIMR